MRPRRRLRHRSRSWRAAVAVSAVVLASATGCGGTTAPTPGKVSVVASTNVWGDIAASIGGRWVEVKAIISRPDQDPHSYVANARDLLAIKDAGLLIENGGGYDDFMPTMINSVDASAPVLNAVALSGANSAPGDLNEHVWYDVQAAHRVADAIAAKLADLAPAHADQFRANAAVFDRQMAVLQRHEARVRKTYAGTPVSITEPLPLDMLNAMGLVNKTPPEFSAGVEEGSDVSARVLDRTLNLYRQHDVAALVSNAQTSGPITQEVQSAATSAGIPVVPVTETVPAGLTYSQWMSRNLARIAAALASADPR